MGQEQLRQKLTQRLSKDSQGVIRTLKSAGIKLSPAEEAGISRGNLDQFSDSQLQERFNTKVLGMLGISANESAGYAQGKTDKAQGAQGAQTWEKNQQPKKDAGKNDFQNKKRKDQ